MEIKLLTVHKLPHASCARTCLQHARLKGVKLISTVMKSVPIFSVLLTLSFSAIADDITDQLVQMRSELDGSCKYAQTRKLKDDKQLSCIVSKLANRCNEIDDCYVYCLGTDLERIGGGCAHICNYRNEVHWLYPKNIRQCASE